MTVLFLDIRAFTAFAEKGGAYGAQCGYRASAARIVSPLDLGRWRVPAVVLSIYNVGGELVLRAERELVAGGVREATRAFGYDRIAWADDGTPV